MVIPKQDIVEGLPIRWAFYRFVSGHSVHGWKFSKWREYLLGFNRHGYEIVFEVFNDESFMQDTKNFLCCNQANTLAGFISFWFKCCKEYEKLLDGNTR